MASAPTALGFYAAAAEPGRRGLTGVDQSGEDRPAWRMGAMQAERALSLLSKRREPIWAPVGVIPRPPVPGLPMLRQYGGTSPFATAPHQGPAS
jgi:hypothetical protein